MCGTALRRPIALGTIGTMAIRRRVEGILAREVEGGLLLLDTNTEHIHQLNATARYIWQRCDDAPSVGAIAELLASEFDVEQDIAVVDVERTLVNLRELGLVTEL